MTRIIQSVLNQSMILAVHAITDPKDLMTVSDVTTDSVSRF
ncbi:hypothetical protein [Pantoea sp. Nvir]|nr:hypothetical protein [Pantoea sp. Nvir]